MNAENNRMNLRPRDLSLDVIPASGIPVSRPYVSESLDSFNWEQALRILRKNWRIGTAFAVIATLLTAAYAFRLKDVYQPVARLEVDPPGSGVLSPRETDASLENSQEYIETQAQILQSDALATRVIRAMRLAQNPEIVGEKNLARYNSLAADKNESMPGLVPASSVQEQLAAADRTPLEAIALRVFRDRLAVSTVRGSRLVEVSFGSHDPRLAQKVTNALVANYIDENFKNRYAATMQASDWLSGQLNDLRNKVEQSNQDVVDYQKRFGLVEEDDKDGPSMQLVTDVSHQLSEAKADRIQLESFVRMIDIGQAASLPQVQSSPTYSSLTTHYAEASAKLAEARAIYGEENNSYKKLANQVSELAAQRKAEEGRIATQVHTSFDAAQEREQLLTKAVYRLRSRMGDINEQLVRYRILKNDAKANADLYNTLLARLKEAGVYAGLKSSNIRIVDPASTLDRPTAPHRSFIIALGALLSGVFAIVLAFAKESLTNTVRSPDDTRDWVGLRCLAMLPLIRNNGKIAKLSGSAGAGSQPGSLRISSSSSTVKPEFLPKLLGPLDHTVEGDALRELQTSLLLSPQEQPLRVILIASSASGEGKSTVALNLAIGLSERGRTCLVDCDVRKPAIGESFGIASNVGWGDVLAGAVTLEKALYQPVEHPRLNLLAVGAANVRSGPLVSLVQMEKLFEELRAQFDFVVIDSPPTVPFSDARILAQLADGVILVGRYGLTTRRALTRCVQRMKDVCAPIVGIVINGMDFTSPDYQYYNFGHSSGKLHEYYETARTMNPSVNSDVPKSRAKGAGA